MPQRSLSRSIVPALLAAALASVNPYASVRAAPAPQRLTPDTFEAIKARVVPTPDELAWQRVRWRDGFFDGLLEAQAGDKPLFYWLYEGDPRGNC